MVCDQGLFGRSLGSTASRAPMERTLQCRLAKVGGCCPVPASWECLLRLHISCSTWRQMSSCWGLVHSTLGRASSCAAMSKGHVMC